MRVILVWAWILWSSDALEHERYYGLGMVALQSSDALEHEHYFGLGMDALVIGSLEHDVTTKR